MSTIPSRGYYDSFLLGPHLTSIKIDLLYSHCLFISNIETNVQLIISTLLAYYYLLWVLIESNYILRIFSPPQCNHTCPAPIRLICVSTHITFHKSRTKISIEVGVKGLEPIVFLMCQIYSLVPIHHLSSTPIYIYYSLQHQRNYIPIGIVPVGVQA